MKVFYINIEKFKQNYDKDFLKNYVDKEFVNEKRFYEHAIGRFLTKSAGKKYYNIKNTEIILNNSKKPVFKNSEIFFSISHSKEYVAVCFNEEPCGMDIEKIKKIDIKSLSKYFEKDFLNENDFFDFWTKKEALYKSGLTSAKFHTQIFQNNYFLTIASKNIPDKFAIIEFDF